MSAQEITTSSLKNRASVVARDEGEDRTTREPDEADSSRPESSRERRPELVAAAARARLLARLLVGDEGVLARELAADLESLVGPLAEVVPLAGARRRGGG